LGSSPLASPTLYQADLCCLGGTEIPLDPAVTGAGYHLYEMVYDPAVSPTEVEVLVDGISHGLIGPAANNFGNRFNFGTANGGASVNANWNLVELTIGTDPPSVELRHIEHLGVGRFRIEIEGPPEAVLRLERSFDPKSGFDFRSFVTTDAFGQAAVQDRVPIDAGGDLFSDHALWRVVAP